MCADRWEMVCGVVHWPFMLLRDWDVALQSKKSKGSIIYIYLLWPYVAALAYVVFGQLESIVGKLTLLRAYLEDTARK